MINVCACDTLFFIVLLLCPSCVTQVSLVKVGITLLLLHRFEEALWSFREALSVRKHALGALHPSTARIYNNIGCVYVEFNEFKEARRAFEAALDIQRSALCNDGDNFPLLFATATTLCNLGYLYRYRDMHAKAASVLAEASELQERVLGQSHSTVLSTIDNLADSCANSGNVTEALKYYNVVLGRFKAAGTDSFGNSKRQYRAEAVLLYKMSRVHRQLKDRGAQLSTLKLALQAIRQYSDTLSTTSGIQRTDTLERRIHYDMRSCREELEKEGLKWL
jgi:tetratricopeptide (TPR) repeat protein